MRRPSRLFTVEVKRSRSRGGEASTTDVKEKRSQKFSTSASGQPAASGQLSWGDLISRAAEEIGAASDLSWADTPVRDEEHPRPVAGKAVNTAFDPFSDAAPSSGALRSRVLPSLLPPEVAPEPAVVLLADEPAVFEEAGEALPPRKPRQRRTATSPARPPRVAAAEPVSAEIAPDQLTRRSDAPAAQPASPMSSSSKSSSSKSLSSEALSSKSLSSMPSLDADHIRAMVEQHLRHRPASRDAVVAPVEGGLDMEDAPDGTQQPLKRRRQDFWKRRLRSRAARD